MKHFYHLCACLAALLVCIATSANGQSYFGSSAYDTINFNGDTLRFTLPGTPLGANGTATLRVIYEGDFGDAAEFMTVFGESSTSIGQAGPHPSNQDCFPEDSIDIPFNANLINTWAANGSVSFRLAPSINVDQFCTQNRAKVRLIYTYCAAGNPVQLANVSAADSSTCPSAPPVLLTGIPVGGTYSGVGVSGNTFDPNGLAAGDYTISYTGTDAIGCTTTDDVTITVLSSPVVRDTTVCPGSAVVLSGVNGDNLIWFDQLPLLTPIDTTTAFNTGILTQTTTFYALSLDQDSSFDIASILSTNAAIIDHNALTSDDRGGMAITPNYVYINGDAACGRYDAGTLANGIALPIRDGMFSDLATGKIWSFWNTATSQAPSNPNNFQADALIELDASLAFTTNIKPLDLTLSLGGLGSSLVLAGKGNVGLFNGRDNRMYIVDIDQGKVEDLGPTTMAFYGAETWASWGILEYNCATYSAVYRDQTNGDIVRKVLPTGAVTNVASFSGLSDMASFTYSPWLNRWYFHYEGGSTTFGGSAETLGYADATTGTSISCGSGGVGCYSPINVNISTVDIGPDVSGCEGDSYTYFAGLGYTSYTWNGVTTNFNNFQATTSGPVIFSGVDPIGCTIRDTAIYTTTPNPSTNFGFSVQGSGLTVAFTNLTTGAGSLTYAWDFGNGQSSTFSSPTHTYTAAGQYDVCLTATQSNGCEATFCDRIILPAVGISEGLQGSVTLFPNPASGLTKLRVALDEPTDLDLHMMNALGQVVHHERLNGFQQGELNLDLSKLAAGIYMVRLSTDSGSTTLRLVVE
jgi:PKD repeat protein